MTPEKLRDYANLIECKGALSAKETAEHYRAHAAALEELAEERKLCEYFANGSIYWQHKYEAALEEIERLNGELAELKELLIEKTKVERGYRDAFVKAERRAERLKWHAEAMATKYEAIRSSSVSRIDHAEAELYEAVEAYRAEFKEE